jgi:membrane protease YdiL (CAAX protease family)
VRRLSVVIYGGLALTALGIGALRGEPNVYLHPAPVFALDPPARSLLSLSLGLLVASSVVVVTKILVRRTRWARSLHVELRSMLGSVDAREIVVLAVASGVAEEMFFRGALLPSVGVVVSSLVFGAVHVGRPFRRFMPWTVWATVMGFVFAGIHALTGELLGAVVAHVLINHENLHYLRSHDPDRRRGARAALVTTSTRV